MHGAEVLAVQPPGRAMRGKEAPLTTCAELAAALLPVVAFKLLDAPYVVRERCMHVCASGARCCAHETYPARSLAGAQVVAHSVGTWVAYELLRLAQRHGLPMPRRVFLSAMASPDIPAGERPWRQQRGLDEREFQVSSSRRAPRPPGAELSTEQATPTSPPAPGGVPRVGRERAGLLSRALAHLPPAHARRLYAV